MKILSIDKDKEVDKRLRKMANESRFSFAELKAVMDLILEKKNTVELYVPKEAFDKLEAVMLVADQYNVTLQDARERVC